MLRSFFIPVAFILMSPVTQSWLLVIFLAHVKFWLFVAYIACKNRTYYPS